MEKIQKRQQADIQNMLMFELKSAQINEEKEEKVREMAARADGLRREKERKSREWAEAHAHRRGRASGVRRMGGGRARALPHDAPRRGLLVWLTSTLPVLAAVHHGGEDGAQPAEQRAVGVGVARALPAVREHGDGQRQLHRRAAQRLER